MNLMALAKHRTEQKHLNTALPQYLLTILRSNSIAIILVNNHKYLLKFHKYKVKYKVRFPHNCACLHDIYFNLSCIFIFVF